MNTVELTGFPLRDPSEIVTWRGLLEFEKTLFVIVNVMDVVMTSLLLHTGEYIESNPIAAYFLTEWGIAGMTVFKLVVVAVVLLIANVIAISRIQTSRYLLHFGTCVVGMVVTYSVVLMWMHLGWI